MPTFSLNLTCLGLSYGLSVCSWLLIAILAVWFTHNDITYALSIAIYFVTINVLFLSLFWLDKQRAVASTRRVSESKLLAISWFAGNMTMFIAQKWFRHKCQKWQFNSKLLLLSFVQTVFMLWLSYRFLIQ